MTRTIALGISLASALALSGMTALANGGAVGSAPSGMAAQPTRTPAEMARETYNNGIEHRDKGDKLSAQALIQPTKDRDKTAAKAHDEYAKALKDFKKAADLDPTLYQAFNGMGYAYRKTGDYVKALEMYDAALTMAPGFPDAVEYRGEAYLALNRVEDAKQAYLTLFGSDRTQAGQLLKAMSAWVSSRQATPGTVEPTVVSALDAWIKERAGIAASTVAMGRTGTRSIWN